MHLITPRTALTAQRWRHLSLMLLVSILSARAASAGPPALDVTVASVQGEVHVTSQARQLDVHKSDVVALPATIYTGPSGSIELRQGNTTLSAAPNSQLMIPVPAVPGEAIDRVIQSRGNAFYNVAKRQTSKLHVESAYLVAVIKGTQFSVVAQDDSATISLFEGRLEVRATDGSDVVDLKAGEIAVRHANDSAIRMLRMDTGEPVAHRARPASPASPGSAAELAPAGSSSPTTVGGEAGDLRGVPTDSGVESTGSGANGVNSWSSTSLGSGPPSVSGGVAAGLAGGSTSVTDGVTVSLGNKSSGNGHSGANGNGQGAGNNGNGQNASNNGNGQGAGNNGSGQNASHNGNGQGAGNNGNGQNASNNGNGQGTGNNGKGQNASNNGNGQNSSNNGNGQNPPNNGNGHGGSNKTASGRSLNLGGPLNSGVTIPLIQNTGANLGTGAPAGSTANSNPVGGLLGSMTRHKGSSVLP